DGTGFGIRPRFLGKAAQHQRAHDPVAVDAAHRRYPGPAYRLAVGHHGQRLQRRLSQPDLLAVTDETLDERRAILAGVEPPAAGDLAQVEAPALGYVGRGQVTQFGLDLVPRALEHLGQHHEWHRLHGHKQDGLEAGPQPGAGVGGITGLGARITGPGRLVVLFSRGGHWSSSLSVSSLTLSVSPVSPSPVLTDPVPVHVT